MSVKDAMQIIEKEYPDMSIVECLEFPEFYGFALTEKGRENEPFGGGYVTVSKTNGDVSIFIPTDDLQLFMSAKPIEDIKQ